MNDLLILQLECWFNTDKSFDCLNEKEAANVKNNILLEDIQRAQNESDFLGETYIASCGILTNFRKDYVCDNFGCDSSCSFNEIQDSLKNILEKVALKNEQNKYLLNHSIHFVQTMIKDLLSSNENINDLYSQDGKRIDPKYLALLDRRG